MKVSDLRSIQQAMAVAGIPQASPARRLVEREIATIETKTNHEVNSFKTYCVHFGMRPEHLGAKFFFRGSEYQITGLNPAAPKFAVNVIRTRDRKPFRFPHREITRYLGVAA